MTPGGSVQPCLALLPHQFHVQRLKLGGGLPAVLVHVGDVLGQPAGGGNRSAGSCAPSALHPTAGQSRVIGTSALTP